MSSANPLHPPSVQKMFDRVARRYDLLNRVISFHLDTYWRNKAVAAVVQQGDRLILDLGTGTGDLAFTASTNIGEGGLIVGLDFSLEMLRMGQTKKAKYPSGDRTEFVHGSALSSPFKDEVFDGVMTAFVLRNVADLGAFFVQAFRVMKPGGRLVSLDMFPPSKSLFAALYGLYFYRLVPWIGSALARDRKAYEYLSNSVRRFHLPEKVAEMIRDAGFQGVTVRRFLSGAVCLHIAEKPNLAAPRP